MAGGQEIKLLLWRNQFYVLFLAVIWSLLVYISLLSLLLVIFSSYFTIILKVNFKQAPGHNHYISAWILYLFIYLIYLRMITNCFFLNFRKVHDQQRFLNILRDN